MAGLPPKVQNPNSGGSTTTSDTSFTISDALNAAKTVTVWVDKGSGGYNNRDLIKAIKVKYSDGTERVYGNQTGTTYDFTFDDKEVVSSMDIWAGDRVDRISWVTKNSRSFEAGGTDTSGGKGGTKYPQKLGNGILLGFTGATDSNELISLGSTFKQDSD